MLHVILPVSLGGYIIVRTREPGFYSGERSRSDPHGGVIRTQELVTWGKENLTFKTIPDNVHNLIPENHFDIMIKCIRSIDHTTFLAASYKIELLLHRFD